VETDAPYLSPIPHRGKRCVPDFVSATAAFIADLRGERPDDLAAWTTRNAVLLFDLPDPWATA
jgi:TatD DNase family protein